MWNVKSWRESQSQSKTLEKMKTLAYFNPFSGFKKEFQTNEKVYFVNDISKTIDDGMNTVGNAYGSIKSFWYYWSLNIVRKTLSLRF